MDVALFVSSVATGTTTVTDWGKICWLIGSAETPGAEQTFGVVTIMPGKRNPLHVHPNCEEILYVMSGKCDHKLGDEVYPLTPGEAIRIPRGIQHWAKCTSVVPLVAVIAFSSLDRQVDSLEEGGVA